MKTTFCCTVLIALGICMAQGTLYAEDFSADMVSTSAQGAVKGKIYMSGEKIRMDMPQASTISRMDKKIVWMLMPDQKMYMEQPLDPRMSASVKSKMDGEIERVSQGPEMINGRKTTKYQVTFEVQGHRESVFQWIDESIQFPVKTAAVDGTWSSEFNNISSGPQDQGLFEIPAGYNNMTANMPDMGALMDAAAGKKQ